MKEKGVYCTVNTDAGYSYHWRRGSYAYWIVYTGKRITGGGVFKENHTGPQNKGPYESEMKAIINALEVIKKKEHPPIIGFVFNRDNINTKSGKNGNELEKLLYKLIRYFKEDAMKRTGMYQINHKKDYAQFRHVKAHLHTDTPRHYVNDWLDKKCKSEFAKWVEKQTKQNP